MVYIFETNEAVLKSKLTVNVLVYDVKDACFRLIKEEVLITGGITGLVIHIKQANKVNSLAAEP